MKKTNRLTEKLKGIEVPTKGKCNNPECRKLTEPSEYFCNAECAYIYASRLNNSGRPRKK